MYTLQAQNTSSIPGSYSTTGAAGIVCGMAPDDSQSPLAQQPDLAMRNELTTQLSLAPSRFVVINTAGVVELEKRRPADALAIILEERKAPNWSSFSGHTAQLRWPPCASCWPRSCLGLAAGIY